MVERGNKENTKHSRKNIMGTILDFVGKNNDTGKEIGGFVYSGSDLCTEEDADFALEYACDRPEKPRTYKGVTYNNYAHFFQENPNFFSIYDYYGGVNEDGSAVLRTGEWMNITVDAVWMGWLDDDSKITPFPGQKDESEIATPAWGG